MTGVTLHDACAGLVWDNPNASRSDVRGVAESQVGGILVHTLLQMGGTRLYLLDELFPV